MNEPGTKYYLLSFASLLLKDPRISIAANLPVPNEAPRFRRRFLGGWILVDPGSEVFVADLSDEQADRSIEEGLPVKDIVDMLDSDWHPREDRQTLNRWLKPQGATHKAEQCAEVVFYAEFPTLFDAKAALNDLGAAGMELAFDPDDKSDEGEPPRVETRMTRHLKRPVDAAALAELEAIINKSINGHAGVVTGHEVML